MDDVDAFAWEIEGERVAEAFGRWVEDYVVPLIVQLRPYGADVAFRRHVATKLRETADQLDP